MKYYIRINNQIIGWVIASTKEEALKLSWDKYPAGNLGWPEIRFIEPKNLK